MLLGLFAGLLCGIGVIRVGHQPGIVIEYPRRHCGIQNALALFNAFLQRALPPKQHNGIVPVVIEHAHDAVLAYTNVNGQVTETSRQQIANALFARRRTVKRPRRDLLVEESLVAAGENIFAGCPQEP